MIESTIPQTEPATLPVPPTGRIGRSVLAYGVGTALMLVSPLLVFAPAALFHCAMRNGRRAAWGAFAIAATLSGLYFAQVASVSSADAAKIAYTSLAAVILAIALPSMATLPLVEHRQKFGRVLVFAVIASAVGLGMTEVMMRSVADFSPLAVHMEQARQVGEDLAKSNSTLFRDVTRWTPFAVAIVPAMVLIDIALVFVLSLLMYGRISVSWSRGKVGVPAAQNDYLFRSLALPDWTLFAFVLGGLTPLTTGLAQRLAANLLTVVVFLYLLQGLAIFRSLLVRARIGMFGTMAAFLLLVLLSAGMGLLLLAMVGLFDTFFDFRKTKRKDDSHESHTD
ncbi:MAG: DUF2232 domain-containing protein [Thermoanaerobaculia bacterium]|nr:DUF2232 domain-containing protein [Thermoanaerobaculia bacterium]